MPKKKNKGGRPTVMSDKTLSLLKDAFLMGCTDNEACLYAEIHPLTLYRYQKENPSYVEQKAVWKDNPILLARRNVIEDLKDKKGDTHKWYLERKLKNEFSTRTEVTGNDGAELTFKIVTDNNVLDKGNIEIGDDTRADSIKLPKSD